MNILLTNERENVKTIEVGAAIIKEGSKVFATQRGYGDFKDGWEFQEEKMGVKTSQEALVREIKEELDTEIQVGVSALTYKLIENKK